MSAGGGFRCCMANCQSTSSVNRGVKETLFRFPKDAERSTLWINACGRNDLLSKKPIELYNNYRVCRLHFEKKMFLNYKETRLKPHAVPSSIINNKEAKPSLPDVKIYFIGIKKSKPNEVHPLTCNNIEANEINVKDEITSTRIDTIYPEQREIKTVSDVEMQTGSSSSLMTPQKMKLHQRIKKYKQKIAELEAKVQEIQDSKIQDFDTLNILLDKYFPKETANFLKKQALLFQKENNKRKYSAAFK